MELAAVLTAVAALLVSIVVAVHQHNLALRLGNIEIDRRGDEVRRQRTATVVPTMERDQDSRGRPRRRLTLTNRGEAVAREVNFSVEGRGGRVPRIVIAEGVLPIPTLGPGADFPFVVSASIPVAPAIDVTVQWLDDEGAHEETTRVSVL